MTRRLTASSNLENLRKEAKRWLKALRTNDEQARARLQRAYPNAPAEPGLRDIQHALALEHGFAGWTALKHQLAGNRQFEEPEIDRVAWFIENACPDHHVRGGPAHVRALHTAMRVLKRFPEVANDSFYAAIVCGDLEEVERVLAEHPEAANEKGGPKGWEPLLYLCFTRLPLAASNDNAMEIARALLDHGANPNVYFMAVTANTLRWSGSSARVKRIGPLTRTGTRWRHCYWKAAQNHTISRSSTTFIFTDRFFGF